jgi:phosphoglycerate dehydrogenase-like enzyme
VLARLYLVVADDRALVKRLRRFDVVCVMRERTPLPRTMIESLPRLKMIASTGTRNRSVDSDAASERGIVVTSTGYFSEPTVELTWALIHASIRDVAAESRSVRAGGWQRSLPHVLRRHGREHCEMARRPELMPAFGLATVAAAWRHSPVSACPAY